MMGFFLQKILPIVLVFAYLILPLDLLPDLLGPIGRIDDVVMLGLLVWYLLSGKSLMGFLGGRFGWERPGRPAHDAKGSAANAKQTKEETNPYRILEVDPGAPAEEIRRAYRRQVARYHPDRVSHLGEEFQTLAHQKFIRIQEAYEAILRARGVSP